MLRDSSPLNIMVKCWDAGFKMGWASISYNPCVESVGCPFKVTAPEKIEKIHKIAFADHRVKVSDIAETIGISTECVHNILHENVCMIHTRCTRWVPRRIC